MIKNKEVITCSVEMSILEPHSKIKNQKPDKNNCVEFLIGGKNTKVFYRDNEHHTEIWGLGYKNNTNNDLIGGTGAYITEISMLGNKQAGIPMPNIQDQLESGGIEEYAIKNQKQLEGKPMN